MNSQPARAAIVTGASRGIGREIALRLVKDGFAVALGYAGRHDAAEAVAEEIRNVGGSVIAVRGNVAEVADVDALFAASFEAFGRLDAVVCNAGILSMARIESKSLADFDRIMAVNARGTFLMLAKAGEVLGPGGRIVALSSSVTHKATPGYGPYIASKLAVEGLVRVLANELRGRNITVNAIAPGPVATELFFEGKSEAQVAAITKMAPLERLGEPADIAGAVAFLLGPDGGWVNGQIIGVNGGFA